MRVVWCGLILRPHPEEARSAVSKDGRALRAMVRDASLRDAPHHEAHSIGATMVGCFSCMASSFLSIIFSLLYTSNIAWIARKFGAAPGSRAKSLLLSR